MFWKKKNKEKPLQKFYEEDASIINYLTDGLLILDRESKISLVNSRAEEFFGVKKEKLLGKSILELSRFPNFRPLISLLGGEIRELSREEIKIRENFILEVTTVPTIIKKEKVGNLVVLHDVTREKLVDKMKSEFVTLAAHQLRTPTSAVKWSLQMLLDGDLGELNKAQKKIIGRAYRTNDKAIRLVNDLLNLAQIEEGKYLTKLALSSIEDLVEEIAASYEKEIKERKLKVEFKKPRKKIPKIMLDVDKMKIAIKNIFDNAVRYTLPQGKISISLNSNEKEIEVQIKDTGMGIPKHQQEKVFTKFFRAVNITKIDTEGTGLGLYIAKNIIEAHGGVIWFNSEEGKGSTFYFVLPVRRGFGEFITREFY